MNGVYAASKFPPCSAASAITELLISLAQAAPSLITDVVLRYYTSEIFQ